MFRKQLHSAASLIFAIVVPACVAVSSWLATPPALADDHAVSVGDNFYEPASVTVDVGDTVTWTNDGQLLHTVTSVDGLFDSGYTVSPGTTFSYTFTAPGEFAYYCLIHGSIQSGTVRVEGPPVTTAPPQQPTAAPTPAPATSPPTAALTAPPTETVPPTQEPTPTATATPTSKPTRTASPVRSSPTASPTASATPLIPPDDGENGGAWLMVGLIALGLAVAAGGGGFALWRHRRAGS